MSGGGGGGSSETTQGSTAYERAPVAQTFQPTLPGFQDMLVQQLTNGFGSGVNGADLASMLSGLYRPMTAYSFQEPISTTASQYDKSKNSAISTGNPMLDKLLMGEGKVKT